MYLCYLDETGVTENCGTSHFVLAGIAISQQNWKRYDQDILAIKSQYGLENAELHAAWMMRVYPEQQRIAGFRKMNRNTRRARMIKERARTLTAIGQSKNRNRLQITKSTNRRTDAYVHLTIEERKECLMRVAACIATWEEAEIFAVAINKAYAFSSGAKQTELFEYCFVQLVTLFEDFLHAASAKWKEKIYGLLIQDNDKSASRLTSVMRGLQKCTTKHCPVENIIETPLFVDSSLTAMVQLADLCGYAVRRFYENSEVELWGLINQRIATFEPNGIGIRHINRVDCQCVVCQRAGPVQK